MAAGKKQYLGRWYIVREDGFYLTQLAVWSPVNRHAGSWHPESVLPLLLFLQTQHISAFAIRTDALRLPPVHERFVERIKEFAA